MRIGILNEIKSKHSIDSTSKKRTFVQDNVVPDEVNREICLNCPLKRCKPRCGLLRRDKQ